MGAPSLFTVAVLCCTLFLSINSQGNEECLANSVAPLAAQKLRNAITQGANFLNLDTKAEVVTALTTLVNVSNSMANDDLGAVIVGTDTKDFYGVRGLDQDYWIFDVKNPVVFGDSIRRQWVTRLESLNFDSTPDKTFANYDPTARPWYKPGQGWDTYPFAGGFQGAGANGSTYHIAFPGGVAAVDRNFKEQCSQCLEGSMAIAVSSLLRRATQIQMDGGAWQEVIKAMFAPFQALRNDHLPSVVIGTAQGRAYIVTSCKSNPSQCVGVNTPFTAQVSAEGVTPVGKVATFPLSANGEIGAATSNLIDFDPRTRPWYNLGDGWTGVYQFASGSDVMGRTFSRSFNGGVTGVDRFDTEPCNGCPTCTTCTTPPTSSPCKSSGANNEVNINFSNMLNGMR